MQIIKQALYRLFRLLPLKSNVVLFFSYYGEHFSGSPKYLSLFFQEKSEFRIVWAFTKPNQHIACETEKVKYNSIRYFYYLAVSGTVITNYRMTEGFSRRRHQNYIQTWHSSLRLKMIEKDAEDTLPSHYVHMAKQDSKQISLLLAGSEKSKEIFERAFWYDGPILASGTPQCDIFFKQKEHFYAKIRDTLHLDQAGKIALYAPTFRKSNASDVYNLNYSFLADFLERQTGEPWTVLVRLHPHYINHKLELGDSARVISVTDYDDVQELLCASDLLITDFSAIMFDFACLRRPCFLYAPDYEAYIQQDRNLYFSIEDLPFPLAKTQSELHDIIAAFQSEEYLHNLSDFLSGIGNYDDGNACERVYNAIKVTT